MQYFNSFLNFLCQARLGRFRKSLAAAPPAASLLSPLLATNFPSIPILSPEEPSAIAYQAAVPTCPKFQILAGPLPQSFFFKFLVQALLRSSGDPTYAMQFGLSVPRPTGGLLVCYQMQNSRIA